MNTAEVEVEIANWPSDADAMKAIRTMVFIKEQNVPAELEWDGLDNDCTHFIARSNSQVIATARLKPDGQIGRMAVLQQYRGMGIGSKLLGKILNYAIKSGIERVYLHAQVQVIGFYQQFGFITEGEEFMDAGIPHRAMYKKIC